MTENIFFFAPPTKNKKPKQKTKATPTSKLPNDTTNIMAYNQQYGGFKPPAPYQSSGANHKQMRLKTSGNATVLKEIRLTHARDAYFEFGKRSPTTGSNAGACVLFLFVVSSLFVCLLLLLVCFVCCFVLFCLLCGLVLIFLFFLSSCFFLSFFVKIHIGAVPMRATVTGGCCDCIFPWFTIPDGFYATVAM